MEGVVLYIVLVRVFAQVNWKYYTGFTLLCYGKTLVCPLEYKVYANRWPITIHDVVCSSGTG